MVLGKKLFKKEGKFTIYDCAFAALTICAVIFSIWKCRYGFGGNDEPFYLTIPHRLSLGDVLIRDEWHLSQMSAFLTYPFTWMYMKITGGTTGIILASRFMYIAMHCATSIVIYIRLRKFKISAVVASVLFFVFTPYNIMALSYNTMGLDLVALAGVLMATANPKKKASLLFSGLAFAGAVLCNPYLIFVYVLFALCMAVNRLCKVLKKEQSFFAQDYFSLHTFLWFSVGAGILAVILLVFLLSRASFKELYESIPNLLTDPEHPSIPITTKLESYFKGIWEAAEFFFISVVAYNLLLFFMLVDKNLKKHRVAYLIITCLIVLFAFSRFSKNLVVDDYNDIMFPFIYLGITSYVLTENKNNNIFVGLFCLGIFYSMAMCFSSNQYFYVISSAISITNIASMIFTGVLVSEIWKSHKEKSQGTLASQIATASSFLKKALFFAKKAVTVLPIIFVCSCFITQSVMQVKAKKTHVFWDGQPDQLTTIMSSGPANGIITTYANADSYHTLYADIEEQYGDKKYENLLLLTSRTWTYLAAEDMNYATYSAWLSGENDGALSRLRVYFEANPKKIPKYIYIPKQSDWNIQGIIDEAVNYGYNMVELNAGYSLEKS